MSAALPLVSVVVIGRNEGARLGRCLVSVAQMQRPGFGTEVLYVDSASSDGSVGLAEGMGARVLVLAGGATTAARGRNAGWHAAQGQFVLFLDGDTELHPGFVEAALRAMQEPDVAVVWGHRRETATADSLYNRVLDLDWIYPPGDAPFCGGDALFRRVVLETAGGFDDGLIAGEEPELCRRITARAGRIVHLDVPMTGHDLAVTQFGQYWRRATRAGHAYAEVSERFRGTADPFWAEDARRNLLRAGVLVGGCMLGLTLSVVLRRWWPLAAVGAGLLGLAVRTGWKARWKSGDWGTLLLYGVHSHGQQVPIAWGQVQYWLNRRAGRRAGLVEYKKL